MVENYVVLPTDTSNTGKLVRTNQRVIGGSPVEEHFMILQDYTNNFQAQVISGPTLAVTGLAVYAVQAGSYNTYGMITTGSEFYVKAGSIQTYNPLGSTFVLGSVYATGSINIATDLTAIGSYTRYIGSEVWNRVAGSIVNWPGYLGSENYNYIYSGTTWIQEPEFRKVVLSGISPVSGTITIDNRVAGSIVNMPSISITNPETIGSFTNQQITGSVAITTGIIPISGNIKLFDSSGGQIYFVGSPNYAIPISGTATVTGSVFVTGSINLVNQLGSTLILSSPGSIVIVGSVAVTSPINVTTGSEVYIKAGSIQTYTPLGSTFVLGSVYTTGSINIINQYLGSKSWLIDTIPNSPDRNNPAYKFEYIISGTTTGITGSRIGSITEFIGAGSYVKTLIYSNDLLTTVGSYS